MPLPPSLRPGHHELVSGVATALDLVALEDAPQVMAAWEAAHARGAARVAVHPAAGTRATRRS